MLDAMLKGFLVQNNDDMDEYQRETFLDSMYGMLGWFDGEICYIENMIRVEANYDKYISARKALSQDVVYYN